MKKEILGVANPPNLKIKCIVLRIVGTYKEAKCVLNLYVIKL